MTSLITCRSTTQEQKIQIMLTFYEKGLLKYGSRGRPSKTKLLKRYMSLFEPSVQLTDIATVLEDTGTEKILSYSDLSLKHNDTREPAKSIFYSDFSLNNSEFYAQQQGEQGGRVVHITPNTTTTFGSLCKFESFKVSESSTEDSTRQDHMDHNICDTKEESLITDTHTTDTNRRSDSTESDNSYNQATELVSESTDAYLSLPKVDNSQDKYSSKTNTADNCDRPEKLCYMEQLGLKPSAPLEMECPKECENIFDTFQRFIAADENSKRLENNTKHHGNNSNTMNSTDSRNNNFNRKVDTVIAKTTCGIVTKGEIVRHKNQNNMSRKLAYSQGGLKKNLKMFARDLQIYAHQRKSSKSKVHVQIKPVGNRQGNKMAALSEWPTSKSKQCAQDEKLKEVITKLKGKQINRPVSLLAEDRHKYKLGTYRNERLGENMLCSQESDKRADKRSQSSYSEPNSRGQIVPVLKDKTKHVPVNEVKDLNESNMTDVTLKESIDMEEQSNCILSGPKTQSRKMSVSGPYVVNYGKSNDECTENQNDAMCERKQYFMRQRRLIKFPSAIPSSMLKFIRSRKTSCGVSLRRSADHLTSKKVSKGTEIRQVPIKSINGGFNKRRNPLKFNCEEKTESAVSGSKPIIEGINTKHSRDSRKRKLSDSSIASTESTTVKRRTVPVISQSESKSEQNPERFLKEFSRHNWLINKYQLQAANIIKGSEGDEISGDEKVCLGDQPNWFDEKEFISSSVDTESDAPKKYKYFEPSVHQTNRIEASPDSCKIQTETQSNGKSPSQLNKSPPLLIPVSQNVKSTPPELQQTSILPCHLNMHQLPKIPPLKHDEKPENLTANVHIRGNVKGQCGDIQHENLSTCKSDWKSSPMSEVSTAKSAPSGKLQNDLSQEGTMTQLNNCHSMVKVCDDAIISNGRKPNAQTETTSLPSNPENVIVIAPSDDEQYNQVPTPIASSIDESDPNAKPGLIPLCENFNVITENNNAIALCKSFPKENKSIDKTTLADHTKPVQIVNTSFLPGSVLVVCNTPVSTPNTCNSNQFSSAANSSVLQSQNYISHENFSSTLRPVLPKMHSSLNKSRNDSVCVDANVSQADPQPGFRQVPGSPSKSLEYIEKSKGKQAVHYVDLTKDNTIDASLNTPSKGTRTTTKTSSHDSNSSDETANLEKLLKEIILDVSDDPDQPELKKLRHEYLKFSKIFKRLTDIEEMKKKERKVLQEKKIQATMLMQTIKKQYENIKHTRAPKTSESGSAPSASPRNKHDTDNNSSAYSVQAHSKQNRVKLLIDCEPPPAHKNSSKCIDYVSLSNVECDFGKHTPASTTGQCKNGNNVPVYSVHLKKQDKEGKSLKNFAVDLSQRNDKTSGLRDSDNVPLKTVVCSPNDVNSTSFEKDRSKVKKTYQSESVPSSRTTTTACQNTTQMKCVSLPQPPTSEFLQLYHPKTTPVSPQEVPQFGYPSLQFPQRPPRFSRQLTFPLRPHAQVQQQLSTWPVQPARPVQQPRFQTPTSKVQGREAPFRPPLPQRIPPYRLGNLVTTAAPQYPYMAPIQTIPNMPPRIMTHGNSIRTPAVGPQVFNPQFQPNRPLVAKPPTGYTIPATQPDQMPRPYLQQPPVRHINPQWPMPIRRCAPVSVPNSMDTLNEPSAFIPLSQVNKVRNPNIPQSPIRNLPPGLPVQVNAHVQVMPGAPAVFGQHPQNSSLSVTKHAPQNVTVARPKSSDDVQSMWMQFNMGVLKCGICQKKAMFVCSRCKEMPYCSEYCQTESWSEHAPLCGQHKKSA